MSPEQQAPPDQANAPATPDSPAVPAGSAPPAPARPARPSKWTGLPGVLRSRLARQVAIVSAIAGAVVAIGHVVGGLIGWWHLYELAFLRGHDARQASAQPQVAAKPRLSLVVLPLASESEARETQWFSDLLSTDLAMQGWSVWFRGISPENSLEAARLFEAAVARDPDSIRGWAGVGLVWGNAVTMGFAPDPKAALARRQEAVRQLERLDPNDPLTLMSRTGGFWYSGDFKGLLRLTQQIVERVPNNPFGFHYLALANLNLGRFEECVAPARHAILLGPRDSQVVAYRATLAMCHFMAEKYTLAAEEALLAADSNTALAGPVLLYAAALARSGKTQEAKQILESRRRGDPHFETAVFERILKGTEPRLESGRERLVSTLKGLGVP